MSRELKEFLPDYEMDTSIFSDEDETIRYIKRALLLLKDSKPSDYIIFMMYVEDGSLRKVGRRLGVSHTIVYKLIKQIRIDLNNIIEKLKRDDISRIAMD